MTDLQMKYYNKLVGKKEDDEYHYYDDKDRFFAYCTGTLDILIDEKIISDHDAFVIMVELIKIKYC